jgi:integrase
MGGCLYYAALRPAEAVALRADSCDLLFVGWGQLTLTGSLPRSARAWTGNGTPREARRLKLRPDGAIWIVPIPPQLVRLLRHHLHAYGCAADGRLFRGARGGPTGTPPLRPAPRRLSLRLASGAPPAEIAARAGHSVRVLLTVYAHCIPGCDQIASQQIEQALSLSQWSPAGPQEST